jgi:hypothetical protein
VSLAREQLAGLYVSFVPADLLLRRFLNLLAGLPYAGANVVDGMVNGASRTFYRTAGTSASYDGQCQNCQCEDCFHGGSIERLVNCKKDLFRILLLQRTDSKE